MSPSFRPAEDLLRVCASWHRLEYYRHGIFNQAPLVRPLAGTMVEPEPTGFPQPWIPALKYLTIRLFWLSSRARPPLTGYVAYAFAVNRRLRYLTEKAVETPFGVNRKRSIRRPREVLRGGYGTVNHDPRRGRRTYGPLSGTNVYTLFCTWLAPEMSRPGCVWSHVLFIEFADLATLVDLASLKSLFRRPKQSFQAYEVPLSFTPNANFIIPDTSLPTTAASKELLLGLYAWPEQPLVAIADENAGLERVTFAIWSQQWPRLRREFRFSTGSFADRGRTGAPFELQISPTANRRAWQRSDKFTLIGRQENQLSTSSSIKWLRYAETDLAMPDIEGFRAFLRSYGADVGSPRSAFSRLAETFERTHSAAGDWRETLEAIGNAFPDPSDALTLKRTMVEAEEDSNHVPLAGRVAAIISFFLTSPLAPAFARAEAGFSEVCPVDVDERQE
jgi:hypothetical protein